MARGRGPRIAQRLLAGAALLVLFAGASSVGFVLHLDLPAARRLTSRVLGDFLSDLFQGSFEIADLSVLSPTRIATDAVIVRDPDGRVVLHVKQLRAELDGWDIAKKLLSSEERVTLIVPHVSIERAEAQIAPDPKLGTLGIARAFRLAPRPPSEKTGKKSARQVRVWLPSIELDRGFARGRVGDLPTLEAELWRARGQVLVSPVGVAVDVPRFATTWRGMTGADLTGIATFHLRGDRHVWTSFDGHLGELQVDSVVKVDDGVLTIDLDLPRAEPAAVRALWPDWPVQRVADGHVEATGTPDRLDTVARLVVGPSRLTGRGTTRLAGDVGVNLDVTGEDVDLRAVWPDAPESRIDGFTTLSIWNSPSGVAAELNAKTEPFELAGVNVPALDLTGTVERGRFDARAIAHEPGLPLRLDFTSYPGGKLELTASTRRFRLENSPRIAAFVEATGYADGELHATLENQQLDASGSAELERFRSRDVALGRGKLEFTARGPIGDPRRIVLDTRLSGSDLSALGHTFTRVSAQARGSARHPVVSARLRDAEGREVEAKATLTLAPGARTSVSDLALALAHDDTRVQAEASRIELGRGALDIADLRLTGAGDLHGSLSVRPGLVNIEARGDDVDLTALGRLLGLPRGTVGGRLDVDTEVVVAKDLQRGRLEVELTQGAVAGVAGLSVALEATLDGQALDGTAKAELAGIARGTTQFDLELEGSAAESDTWRRLLGRSEFRLDELDLSHLAALLPASLRIERTAGKLTGQVVVTRDDPEAVPSVTLLAGTTGLVVQHRPDPEREPVLIQGIELQLGSRADGSSGDVDGTLRLLDAEGSLASATVRTHLPLKALVSAPSRTVPELLQAPLLGKVVVDARPVESLPELVRPEGVHGVLRADVTIGGSVTAPRVNGSASVARFVVGSAQKRSPVDLCARASYTHETSELSVDGEAFLPREGESASLCRGERVAALRSVGKLDLTAPAEQGGPPSVFQGEAGVVLEGLPIETIGPLARGGIGGRARGVIAFEQGEGLPQLNARLDLERLVVDTIDVGDGRVEVRSDGRALRALAHFDKQPGAIDAELKAQLAWAGFVPRLDKTSALSFEARADRVDAVILAPALRDVFSELSGPMNGKVRLSLVPDPDPSQERWNGEVSGDLTMKDGSMQLEGLGMRLNSVQFRAATLTRNGRTVIEVRDFSAASRARSPNVSASGDVYLDGLEFSRARANVNLKDVPILIEGVSQANATGRAFMDLVPQEDKNAVLISVPQATADLPPSSGRDVLSLEPNRSIEIVQPLAEPRRRSKGRQPPKPWELTFVLGKNVKVQRSDLNLPLTGKAVITLAEATEVGGTLLLEPGGRAEYWGKTFVIESGELRFDTGEPSNPHVNVVATWRAPDGTQVDIIVSGTYREAKLELRSDPQRTEAEIYALLLGGGTTGDEGGSSAAAAGLGVGAGVLDRLLSDTPLRNVELRTGSEEASDQRRYATYTAAVQVSDEIWFEGSYKSASSQTDTAEQSSAFSGTVDWRFRRNWSLRTEVGTIGTALDLLWTYRY